MAFYTFAYLIWSVSFATACYCIFCGHLPMINAVLSHQVFTPFARLTYNAYDQDDDGAVAPADANPCERAQLSCSHPSPGAAQLLAAHPPLLLRVERRGTDHRIRRRRVLPEVRLPISYAHAARSHFNPVPANAIPASLCIFLALEKPAMGAVSLLLYTLNGGGVKGRGGAQGADEGATAASGNNGTGAGERLLARQDGAPVRAGSFLEHQTRTERQLSTVADADNEAVAMATPQIDNNLRASGGAAAQVAAQLAPRDL